MNVPISPTIPGSQNLQTLTANYLNINGIDSSSVGLEISNKHIKTHQTVAPTISSGSLINATDVAGIITFTSTGLAGLQTTVTFRTHYEVAPIVLLTPRNVNAAVNNIGYYVTSTLTGFSINASFTTGAIPHEYFYMVIQSN